MIVWTFLLTTLLLASWSLVIAWRAHGRAWRYSWRRHLLAASMAAFIYRYGGWAFASVYLRYAFATAWLLLFLFGFSRKKILAKDQPRYRSSANLVAAFFLLVCIVLYYTGATGRPRTIALRLPFRHGTYLVQQGGKGLPTNVFHVSARGAVYAIDFVKLNRWGNRANTVFSKNLADYNIFGDTVYAPCAGRVLRAIDDNEDNIPPLRRRGPHNLNGVLIEAAHCYVFPGHLKQHCVFVQPGNVVATGQPLGLAGNSGMSLEPHLHLQVHAKGHPGLSWYRRAPLYRLFKGLGLLPNDVVAAR